MDMRSLNTSLPRTTHSRTTGQQQSQPPPESLLSAFKAAALSVTALYKNAASDQARSRAAGYQDALDELLVFLDRESLGLGDGEGWRVRQWATERLDGGNYGKTENDDDEYGGAGGEQEEQGTSSPERTRRRSTPHEDAPDVPPTHTGPEHPAAQPSDIAESTKADEERTSQQHHTYVLPQAATFDFESSHQYPSSNHDREVVMSTGGISPDHNETGRAPIRVELLSRAQRNNRHSRTHSSRQAGSSHPSLGSGAGAKRKAPLGDFFDITGLSFDGKDGTGRGGKRGRHT